METVIRNAGIVNEGKLSHADLLIRNERIERIGTVADTPGKRLEIDAQGMLLFPGAIDDQVHFREPGLTHKGDLQTESKAAVAGGVTSYMEMPNTVPGAVTIPLLEEKYSRASQVSMANYSFFMGTTNSNIEEIKRVDPLKICGVKVFMGSSTGDMLVDNRNILEHVFRDSPTIIAAHCEDDPLIKANLAAMKEQYGDDIPVEMHPLIRSAEACYKSSSYAVELAKSTGARLHILHISTAKELELFRNDIPLEEKKITAEACIHHLWFTDVDYATKGNLIKWNPAVKTANDREAIRKAVIDGRIDVIATDHAPHTLEEKAKKYSECPSGGPLVQHSLVAMLEFVREGWITPVMVAEKMAHSPARLFNIKDRGYIREGYYADLVLVHMQTPWQVSRQNLYYKCGWSPLEGTTFHASVDSTFVNGYRVYHRGIFMNDTIGKRLEFNRLR